MTAAVSVPAAEVIGHRYAARRKDTQHVGHLLTRTWVVEESAPGRARPALCGVRAQQWRAVDSFARPEVFHDCADCSRLAGIVLPPPKQIIPPPRLRPGRRRDPLALSAAPAATSQAERAARRAAFRDAFRPVPEARSYVPRDDERTATYEAFRGIADGWPIPLTPCTK